MKLGDFLNHAPPDSFPREAVEFLVLGRNKQTARVAVKARALLELVDEVDRQEAIAAALATLAPRRKDGPVPAEVEYDERTYEVLFRALRDADNPVEPFFATVLQLKHALTDEGVSMLARHYKTFCEKHYPAQPTPKQKQEVTADADRFPAGAP